MDLQERRLAPSGTTASKLRCGTSLCESFRIRHWKKDQQSGRLDAFPDVPYHVDKCAWARKRAALST